MARSQPGLRAGWQVRRVGSLSDAWSMPYVFPHEELFALVMGALIIGLLLFRLGVARRRDNGGDRGD